MNFEFNKLILFLDCKVLFNECFILFLIYHFRYIIVYYIILLLLSYLCYVSTLCKTFKQTKCSHYTLKDQGFTWQLHCLTVNQFTISYILPFQTYTRPESNGHAFVF